MKNELVQSFNDLKKNWKFIPVIIALDVVFLIVFGFVYSLYFDRILAYMTDIMSAMPAATAALQQVSAPTAQALSSVYGINASLSAIYKLAILLAISTFVIWIVFQSVIWSFAHRIAESKTKFLEYLKGFSVVSVIWFAIFSVIMYFSISATLNNAFNKQIPAGQDSWVVYGTLIAVAVLGYFVIVSYSLTGKIKEILKKTFVYCLTRPKVLLSYLILLVTLLVINLVLLGLWFASKTLSIAVGIVLVLLYLVFARVYMIETIKKLEKKK